MNNIFKNKVNYSKGLGIITIIGMIVGILLVITGFLILQNEYFSSLFIKIISVLKNKSPYLLVEGKPVFNLWLIKLFSLAKVSIISGILIFLFSLEIFIFIKIKKPILIRKELLIESKSNLFFFLITGATGIVIILIIVLGLISWPVADDFHFYSAIKSSTVFEHSWELYMNWGGRFSGFLLTLIPFSIINIEYSYLIVVFYACCLIITAYLLAFFLKNLSIGKKFLYYDFGIITCILWLGLLPIAKEVIYWASGGVYILTTLLAILWIFIIYTFLFKIKTIKYKYLSLPLLMIFSFFIGSSQEILSPALIFITIIMLLLARKKQKEIRFIIVLALMFLTFGTIFMYIAPGNFIRAKIGADSFNFSIIKIVHNYFNALLQFSRITLKLIILTIIGAFSSALFKLRNVKSKYSNINISTYIKSNMSRLIIIISFLISAFITLTPFILIPNFITLRASIYFQIFLLLFIWGIIDYFLVFFINLDNKKIFRNITIFITISIICFAVISITTITISLKNIYYGIPIKDQMSYRHEYLLSLSETEKKQIINVKPIQGKIPEVLNFKDITIYEDHWINQDVADYYNLEGIKLDLDDN